MLKMYDNLLKRRNRVERLAAQMILDNNQEKKAQAMHVLGMIDNKIKKQLHTQKLFD